MQATKLAEVADIIKTIKENNITILYFNDQLKISTKNGSKIPPLLIEKIKDHKKEIIELLKTKNAGKILDDADYDLWFDEKSLKDINLSGNDGTFAVMHQQEKEFLRFLIVGDYGFNLTLKLKFEHYEKKAIEDVFETLFLRHESLRTTFTSVNGETRQVINSYPLKGNEINYVNIIHHENKQQLLNNIVDSLSKHPFNFEKGPLVKITIVHYAEDVNYLLFTSHHVISDEESLKILRSELTELYNAYTENEPNPLPPLEIQYKEYAQWVNNYLASDKGIKSKKFYKEKILKSLIKNNIYIGGEVSYKRELEEELKKQLKTDTIEFPFTKAHGLIVNIQLEPGASYRAFLNASNVNELKKIAAQNNVSTFTVVVTLMSALFFKIKGQRNLRIYIPYTTRVFEKFDHIIGWLVGEVILCVDIEDDVKLDELIATVDKEIIEVSHHRFYPHEKLMSDLDIPLNILAPIQLNFIKDDGQINDFTPKHSDLHGAHFDFRCAIIEHVNGIEFNVDYKLSKYSSKEVEIMCSKLVELLTPID